MNQKNQSLLPVETLRTFTTVEFNNQLSRSLGKCTVNFAEVGECFAVADRIEDGKKKETATFKLTRTKRSYPTLRDIF
jgi:hypothetical protein